MYMKNHAPTRMHSFPTKHTQEIVITCIHADKPDHALLFLQKSDLFARILGEFKRLMEDSQTVISQGKLLRPARGGSVPTKKDDRANSEWWAQRAAQEKRLQALMAELEVCAYIKNTTRTCTHTNRDIHTSIHNEERRWALLAVKEKRLQAVMADKVTKYHSIGIEGSRHFLLEMRKRVLLFCSVLEICSQGHTQFVCAHSVSCFK